MKLYVQPIHCVEPNDDNTDVVVTKYFKLGKTDKALQGFITANNTKASLVSMLEQEMQYVDVYSDINVAFLMLLVKHGLGNTLELTNEMLSTYFHLLPMAVEFRPNKIVNVSIV